MSDHVPATSQALSKKAQRKLTRSARKALSQAEVTKGSQRIVRSVLGTIPLTDIETAAIYWPVGNEVDLRPLVSAEETVDLTFALPVVEKEAAPLRFAAWKPGDQVTKGVYGESVPAQSIWVRPQLVFVPVVGFDRSGFRIGQGGGYYDRTLADLRASGDVVAVGVAFSVQECLNIAREDHDEPLERIVTEREVITF